METTLSRRSMIAGWVLAGLITAMLVLSAAAKFFSPEMAADFAHWGLGEWRVAIGLGELVSALLFLFPRTHRAGLLLLSAYFGGAIVIHLSHGEPFVVPAVLLVVVWVTGVVRGVLRV